MDAASPYPSAPHTGMTPAPIAGGDGSRGMGGNIVNQVLHKVEVKVNQATHGMINPHLAQHTQHHNQYGGHHGAAHMPYPAHHATHMPYPSHHAHGSNPIQHAVHNAVQHAVYTAVPGGHGGHGGHHGGASSSVENKIVQQVDKIANKYLGKFTKF
eukprot:jgi/Chrzof1/3025/Cz12g08190.t1